MKVLVVNDQDGHCHAFDISTEEQRLKVYAEMAEGFLKKGTGNCSAKTVKQHEAEFRSAIESQDLEEILKLFETIDLHFDRSGGGVMYEVEVQTEFPLRLCNNVG